MNKLKSLRSSTIKIAIICLGIIAILSGFSYFTSSLDDGIDKEVKSLNREIRAAVSQTSSLEQKYKSVAESIVEYDGLLSRFKAGELSINEPFARQTLTKLKNKYRVNNLTLDSTKEETYKEPSLENKLYKVSFNELKLEFDAISDLHALAFIEDMESNFNAYIRPTYFQITRKRLYNDDLLKALSNGERPTVVSAKASFLWLGIPASDDKKTDDEVIR